MPSPRKNGAFNRALEEAMLRYAQSSGGTSPQLPLPATQQTRDNLTSIWKGAAIALPAGAADLAGMAVQGMSGPGSFASEGPGGVALQQQMRQAGIEPPPLEHPPFSGDPLREAIGLDPEDPWGIAGEIADPSTAFLKIGKIAMAALKAKAAGGLAAMAPIAKVLKDATAKIPTHIEKVINKLGHSFPNMPEAQAVADLNRADFIYNMDIPATGANTNQVIDVARRFQHDALKVWGDAPMEITPENLRTVSEMWAEEALRSFEIRPEMAGWYKRNLDDAFKSIVKMHPEIAKDQKAKDAYKIILAITSNGQKVTLNARLADDYYRLWKQTGKFPLLGSGKERQAMIKSFEKANQLFESKGHKAAMTFLNSDFTVKEMMEMGFDMGGEKVDTMVKGSRIFGPKIGGGFMQNLMGNFDPATVDMWAKRTYGRYTGRLLADEKLIANQRQALRTAIGRKKKFMEQLGFDPDDVAENDATLDELAEVLHKRFAKTKDPKTGSTYYNKNPLNNAARQLDKSVNKVRDQVSGPESRDIRELMVQTRDIMRARGVSNIDTADVQALLWYAEKDIYAKLGATTDVSRSDYAQAFAELANGR